MCMEELRIHFTAEDLKNPTSAHMERVYESFLDLLMGTAKEEYENPDLRDVLEYPELQMDAVAGLAFFRMVHKFMGVVGIFDFSMKDFLKPTSDRVRRIMSAVINFAKFREEQLTEFEKYTIETDQLTEKKMALEQENKSLAETLHTAKLQRAQEEPAIQQAESEIATLTNEVTQLHKEQLNVQKEFQQLKTQATELSEKINNHKDNLMSIRQTSTKLASQIVENPEKLKQSLLDLDTQLTTEREIVAASEKNSRDLQLKIDSLSQVEGDIDKSLSLMEENDVEMRKLQAAREKVSQLQDTINKKTTEFKEISLKEEHIKKQIQATQEKIVRLQKQLEAKKESTSKKLEGLRNTHSILSSEKSALYSQIEEISTQIREMEKKIQLCRETSESEKEAIRSDFAKLKAQVGFYHTQFLSALQA